MGFLFCYNKYKGCKIYGMFCRIVFWRNYNEKNPNVTCCTWCSGFCAGP